jgi:D-serine deaminase-like pyridoxal phosphate-dependent protein
VRRNISRISRKALANGVRLRPHCKTHQSAEIADWFRQHGIDSLTVSSVQMAEYFASSGWQDITIAFPVNPREARRIDSLASRLRLGILFDSEEAVSALATSLSQSVRAWIKVDVGYGRVGMPWQETDRIVDLASRLEDTQQLEFAGILTHSGHSYGPGGAPRILTVHSESIDRMQRVQQALERRGIQNSSISIGDTPSCSVADDFRGADEIRPGNLVFYDVAQRFIGSCTDEDIAVAVACPVVGKYSDRLQIVVHGGAVHFSKDSLPDKTGRTIFGYLADSDEASLGRINYGAPVVSISHEHGVIEVDEATFRQVRIGDVLLIFPMHSCLACNFYASYRTLDGKTIPKLQSTPGQTF